MSTQGPVRLTASGYEQFRRACRTHREELVVRLAGEVGLRAGEITRVRPADADSDDGGVLLTVREADGGRRQAPLPSEVAHAFQQYIRSNGIDRTEPVVDVSERRVQMLVSEISERAAAASERAELATVTPTTLRQFFAQRLLVEHGVDVRVVTAAGGWEGVDSLLPALPDLSDAALIAAVEGIEESTAVAGERLPAVVDTIDRVVASLDDANSQSALERAVCRQLVAGAYVDAWLLERDPTGGGVVVRAHAGDQPDPFDDATGIVQRTTRAGGSVVLADDTNVPAAGALAAVPISHGETEYGVLVVRSTDDAFSDPERTALLTIGRQIGFGLTAIDRKQLVLGGVVLEVQFRFHDHSALIDLSAALGCPLRLDGAIPAEDGLLCFVRIEETAVQTALEATTAIDGIDDARLIRSSDDGGVLELSLTGSSPLLAVTDRGGTVTDLTVIAGEATLTCELAPDADLRGIHNRLSDRFGAELRSKQEQTPTTTGLDRPDFLDQQLTDKQRDVIRTAYHAGYFEWPRESTAEDLAETMNISSPTLHNHLRRAQQNILEEILADH